MRRILSFCIAGVTLIAAAAQQPAKKPEEGSKWRVQEQAVRLFRALGSLSDWDTHSVYITSALEKTYEHNGWTSEPDRFAMDMLREVNKIPPWKPEARFDAAAAMMADRYDLDEDQQRLMRDTLIRESNDLFIRHSGRIMQYAVEAIQTRAAGEPFTPEQVARWAELAEPVFVDSRERMNVVGAEFASNLRPEQAQALMTDLDAANRRMDDLYVQSQRWAEGDWDPLDWGLEEDPIQTGALRSSGAQASPESGRREPRSSQKDVQPAGEEPTESELAPLPPTSQPISNDVWVQYVRRFIEKYKLDDPQQERAWRIYRDVKARGDTQRSRYAQQIDAAQRRAAARTDQKSQSTVRELQNRLSSQLDQLFTQLKARLDKLPTRQQRASAAPIELEPPRVPAPVDPMPHDGP